MILFVIGNSIAHAEELKKLAEAVQNPVSDLEQVGFTNGTFFGAGDNDYTFNVFNLEAGTTRRFGDWGLLNRLTIPVPYLPASAFESKSGSLAGLGDVSYTAFLARDESKRWFKLIGGVGPTFVFNTATDDLLGFGKWLVGPSLAIVHLPDPWVVGALVRNLWSFAGDNDRRKANLFLLQPFFNYNFENGWYLTSTPGITANWNSKRSRNRWRVPVGGGFGKVMFRGDKRPINIRLQGFYFVDNAFLEPEWTLQLRFQILFPHGNDKTD